MNVRWYNVIETNPRIGLAFDGERTQNNFRPDTRRLSLAVTDYHDEIKPERERCPFLGHGVLFVPDDWRVRLSGLMHAARKRHNYRDEIHFRDIRGARGSPAFMVARDWISDYLQFALKGCPFKAFIAEDGPTRSLPYPGDEVYEEHLLRSSKAAFKGGIAWSYYNESQLRLEIVYDDTDSVVERRVAAALPSYVQSDINTRRLSSPKRYPCVRIGKVRFVASDPHQVDTDEWIDAEFIQLADLLLGASFAALEVTAQPDRQGRKRLARSIMGILGDTLQAPWFQQVPVHRRFSVSIYPDKNNLAYPAALRMAQHAEPAVNPSLPLWDYQKELDLPA